MSISTLEPRFGVWALVSGSWASTHHPNDPVDASWERNKAQILEAEELGYDATLVAQHTINPRGDGRDQLEAWTASAALAALTSRIEIIAAIKPYLFHPVVLAKLALQIEEISAGRFSINLVNAWFIPELEKAGIGFAEHDERYAYGREWITIVRDLISGRRTSFSGRYFDVTDYELAPKAKTRERPTIYVGGESNPARALVADRADVWFINGQPLETVAGLINDVSRRPRTGPAVRFGMSAFVIARETEEEAEAEFQYLLELTELDRPAMQAMRRNIDPKAVMFQTGEKALFRAGEERRVGGNGGTGAGLVGSYETVAKRIQAFNEIGVETFMVQFQPFEAEMRRFAEHVIPRVRRHAIAA